MSRTGGGNAGRVSWSRPNRRQPCPRLTGRGHRPCHSATPISGPAGGQSPRPAPAPPSAGASPPPGRALASASPGPAGLWGTGPSGRGKRGSRFLVPPEQAKASSPPLWQGPSPLPQRYAGIRTGRGPKPPASARPAPGGRFSPAGSGAGLCPSRTCRSTRHRSARAGETRCVSWSRPNRRQPCPRLTGRGHRPCHSVPQPPADLRHAHRPTGAVPRRGHAGGEAVPVLRPAAHAAGSFSAGSQAQGCRRGLAGFVPASWGELPRRPRHPALWRAHSAPARAGRGGITSVRFVAPRTALARSAFGNKTLRTRDRGVLSRSSGRTVSCDAIDLCLCHGCLFRSVSFSLPSEELGAICDSSQVLPLNPILP